MTKALDQHTNNIVVGAGELYIDEHDSSGNLTGERYVGDSVGFSFSVATEVTTIFSGDGAAASKLVEYGSQINRSATITLHDMSPENLALFVGGAAEDSVVQASTAVTDESIKVVQGRWYQLGRTEAKPQGVGAIAAAGTVVTDSAGGSPTTTYTVTTDYILDNDNGRIYIVEGGTIASGVAATIYVDYTPVAATAGAKRVVKSGTAASVDAALRYIETPSTGKGRSFYMRKCTITPSGDMALKSRDTEQQVTLNVAILEPDGSAVGMYIDGAEA